MMRPAWNTREEIQNSSSLIKSTKKESTRNFPQPPTLESDFDRFQEHEHPNIFCFSLIPDWYNQNEIQNIRGFQVPIDWKSKIGNSDMSTNFRASRKSNIRKGDMVIREDGVISLLTWKTINYPNCYASQTTECNVIISVMRDVPEEVNEDGFLVAHAYKKYIAKDLPCVHSEYAGRPDYLTSTGLPGIHADHLITVQMQWNDHTKNIRINDEFEMCCFTYRVTNISIAEVSIDQTYGVLTINAKRIAGGEIIE